MKRIIVFTFLMLNILFFLTADEKKTVIKQYDLDPAYEMDKQLINEYGNLWAIYVFSNMIKMNGSERTPIEEISFYYELNKNYYFLGKYDRYGIYNNKNELIFPNPYADSFIGYIENILEDPFYTGQYVMEERFGPGGFEPYAKVQIDFDCNSIAVKN